eukprot:SM000004S14881  [mRNA]  locus=s4:19787:23592:+ [translate_table: standard]
MPSGAVSSLRAHSAARPPLPICARFPAGRHTPPRAAAAAAAMGVVMRWTAVELRLRPALTPDGKKTPGRKGGATGPGRKWGHTCNALRNGRLAYAFGGYGKDEKQTNDVHIFDTGKQAWSRPILKGDPPIPRDSHTCTTVGLRLFIMGGTDGHTALSDLYILDTTNNTWSQPLPQGTPPAPREGHCAALVGQRIYVFGGCGKAGAGSDDTYFNDIHILDTETITWTKATPKGMLPAPRDSHTCNSWGKYLVVMGGEDFQNSYLNDVWLFDTEAGSWSMVEVTGDIPAPRAGHSAVVVGKHLLVFGGFTDERRLFNDLHVLDLGTGVSQRCITDGPQPSPRFSLAADCVDVARGRVLLYGGCNDTLEALDDMYYLETGLHVEKTEIQRLKRERKFIIRRDLKRNMANHEGMDVEGKRRGVKRLRAAMSAPADAHGRADVKVGVTKPFDAKITNVFHAGYCVEANIDGRILHGLLFSNRDGFAHAAMARQLRTRQEAADAKARLQLQKKADRKAARMEKKMLKEAEGTTPSNVNSYGAAGHIPSADTSAYDESRTLADILNRSNEADAARSTPAAASKPKAEAEDPEKAPITASELPEVDDTAGGVMNPEAAEPVFLSGASLLKG